MAAEQAREDDAVAVHGAGGQPEDGAEAARMPIEAAPTADDRLDGARIVELQAALQEVGSSAGAAAATCCRFQAWLVASSPRAPQANGVCAVIAVKRRTSILLSNVSTLRWPLFLGAAATRSCVRWRPALVSRDPGPMATGAP
jgi:hypothetical protein